MTSSVINTNQVAYQKQNRKSKKTKASISIYVWLFESELSSTFLDTVKNIDYDDYSVMEIAMHVFNRHSFSQYHETVKYVETHALKDGRSVGSYEDIIENFIYDEQINGKYRSILDRTCLEYIAIAPEVFSNYINHEMNYNEYGYNPKQVFTKKMNERFDSFHGLDSRSLSKIFKEYPHEKFVDEDNNVSDSLFRNVSSEILGTALKWKDFCDQEGYIPFQLYKNIEG